MSQLPTPRRALDPHATHGPPLPLSAEQRGIWLHTQTHVDARAYVLPIALRLIGPIDLRVLAEAFDDVVRGHQSLRTGFRLADEGPVRQVSDACRCPFVVTPLPTSGAEDAEDPDEVSRRWMSDAMAAGFQLDRPPLIRVGVLQYGPQQADLLILIHHLVFDGWSASILFRDVSRAYRTICATGSAPAINATADQPLAPRNAEGITPELRERNRHYWTNILRLDRSGSGVVHASLATGSAKSRPLLLTKAASAAVHGLAEQLETSEFVVVAALLALVLSRLTHHDRIVLGYPATARDLADENAIGLFTDTLALPVHVIDSQSFQDLVNAVETDHFDGLDHRPMEADRILRATPRTHAGDGHPVFDALLAFQNVPKVALDLPNVRVEQLPDPERAAEFALTITVDEVTPALRGRIDTDSAVPDGYVDRLVTGLATAAAAAAVDVGRPVGDLVVLGEPDRRLLARVNDT
ncbi:condensation domain-containing protein, partial [Dactylosporangium sp. NPDC051485]|uniref:condensation domain-containing protein n=1 Tax=Dactylosporangium sp. NPDC051485 TaxID=3154846 RepID=UPI0034312B0C